MLESLLIGCILQTLPASTNDHCFLTELINACETDHPHIAPYMHKIVRIGQDYLISKGEAGIPLLIEQFGQEKLHFYPIVSIEGGLKKMYQHGTSLRITRYDDAVDLASNFKREYFVAYFEKHGVLPKPNKYYGVDTPIALILKEGKPGSIRECYKIPNKSWEKLTFDKNHNFNYYPQISDLLDDKAITPHLDHIYQLFAWDALKVMKLKKPKDRENTRLILEILSRPVIDIREFYAEVERSGSIPTNWAIIQLMAKERELKIEARVFLS